ncbi:MAG: MaoC family dehydratase N-terminal domain-containing protein [Sphingomonadales bacterium]|nr:MaoC family dehydratase N-terminal domain-containing protein [Sphingomonadales bacterium]
MSGFDEHALAEWQAAIGRQEKLEQRLEVQSLRRFALATGSSPDVEKAMPALGHWAFFLPDAGDGALGEDGHPRRGGFLPAITLPRRMFAAADIRFEAPLLLGEVAEQVSTITSVTPKSGRSGDLVFVEVERRLGQQGRTRIVETQSYVYRDDGPPTPMPEPAGPDAASRTHGEVWQPGPVNLFRFSAATFNSHRIHYDSDYATRVEGYPALVVHGPFTAARLAGFAERRGALARFAFRAQVPLFLGQPIHLQDGDEGEVRAVRCDGATAMTAKLSYA